MGLSGGDADVDALAAHMAAVPHAAVQVNP